MKNTLKKIASIAMAFTLLGTGTVVTKTISPKSDNILTASAARNSNAYRVVAPFSITFKVYDSGYVTQIERKGGYYVNLFINITPGMVLEIDNNGVCLSDYKYTVRGLKKPLSLKGCNLSQYYGCMKKIY